MSRSVLVIAAHPDDELLGCGGTVALHARAGDEVTAVIACEGESLRYGPGGVGQSEHSRRAAEMLGLKESRQLGFPDQRLDTLTLLDLIAPLERAVREVRPAVVYCQFGGDANRDHELLFRAALVATRPAASSPIRGWTSRRRSSRSSVRWPVTRARFGPTRIPAPSRRCATAHTPGAISAAWRRPKSS